MIVAGTRRDLRRARPALAAEAAPASASTRPRSRRCAPSSPASTEAHRRTLDQLSTGGRDLRRRPAADVLQRSLSPAVGARRRLSSIPSRPTRPCSTACAPRASCPEQADFRKWKAELHEAYRAIEPRQHEWYLPDGRTLRVVTTPNPEGGVTYLLDDVTERLELVRRYEALIRVQGETSTTSTRASRCSAATGGSICTIRPLRGCGASSSLNERIRPSGRTSRPMIGLVLAALRRRAVLDAAARRRSPRSETREPITRRLERTDGSVLDCTTAPLPDGATLVTFHDVTDIVNVERALIERTDALAGCRPAQERVRAARLLRAAHAAHQHHRLRASVARSDDRADHRADHREAARISRLHRPPRPARCSRSSTTSSISPPSMPAPCRST